LYVGYTLGHVLYVRIHDMYWALRSFALTFLSLIIINVALS
jgi:hypothetical protein